MKKPDNAHKVKLGELHLNTSDDKIIENVKVNIRRHLPQARAYAPKDEPCVIAAGGPSLRTHFDELKELHFQRVPIFALNGAGNWLVEQNIRPSAIVIMDAKPCNLAFVEKPVTNCKYFLASQCDPSLFDACEGRDTTIFHVLSTGEEGEEKALLDAYYAKRWTHVIGSNTVGTRAIWLARMHGFELQHVFGLDSCITDEGHHAYSQDWNDDDSLHNIWCAGRHFKCSAWHIAQAEGFKDFAAGCGEHFHLHVHGDGLIAHMVSTGADLAEDKAA